MNASYLEKRIDTRADVEEVLRYKVLGDGEDTITSFKYEKATTRNISKGGVCMVLPHKISEGNVIRVEIPLENESLVIKAFCEVQWCRLANKDGIYEAGLSFIALKDDDAKSLENYINEREAKAM
ncbi:MAG TPA: PilZ domain-containing protein [Candidatus Goldiibacteriota bacterium]|nr:PilZ domain-containing protein [Candidatus Goldiibacteriota bacterium]HPI04252.1 PilZ domain-containing protein [Candidatus Goldiibacteriota bacterium]HPN64722.1 PilZ domain-containing protein [Candidatus Goldiibacteriota bacterium]HRQ44371.1 PilZ domain-containing protein [Candidatus Goldiibacteriota bacterium]